MNNRKMCNKMIADNIKRIRLSKKLTQREVALAINVSTRCYCYYETAQREIPISILINLSNFYRMKIDEIINHQ